MSVTRTPPEHAAANATMDANYDLPLQAARWLEQQISKGQNRYAPRREDSENVALLELLRVMRVEVRLLSERMTRMEDSSRNINRQGTNEEFSGAGRGERDIRHRRSTFPNFLSLKEARTMIPEFDGSSRHKLQEFAIQNINPVKEEALVQSILYTKLKGKAMQDFEMREIQTYEELKRQLETCYLTRQSTTHLQID